MLQVYFVTILPVHIFLTLEQKKQQQKKQQKKKHGNEISPFEFKLIKNLTWLYCLYASAKKK